MSVSYLKLMIKTLNIKHLLAEQEIAQKRSNKVPLGLKDCMEFHMISFHPSDSVQIRLICVYAMMNVLEEILLTVGTQKHYFLTNYILREVILILVMMTVNMKIII